MKSASVGGKKVDQFEVKKKKENIKDTPSHIHDEILMNVLIYKI